jgi:hypothetical protein
MAMCLQVEQGLQPVAGDALGETEVGCWVEVVIVRMLLPIENEWVFREAMVIVEPHWALRSDQG